MTNKTTDMPPAYMTEKLLGNGIKWNKQTRYAHSLSAIKMFKSWVICNICTEWLKFEVDTLRNKELYIQNKHFFHKHSKFKDNISDNIGVIIKKTAINYVRDNMK
jgi:hypothetical protein